MISLEIIQRRNELYAFLRHFFQSRGYLEVQTPLLVEKVVPESSISLFTTLEDNGFGETKRLYLIPSPEITMKKILAAYPQTSLFQIGKSFRNGEVKSGIHSREFTMLEYYTRNADWLDSLTLTENLFQELPFGNKALRQNFLKLTMEEIFAQRLGESLTRCLQSPSPRQRLAEICHRHGLRVTDQDSDADLFNLIFVSQIEPFLPTGVPVALLGYPSLIATTAATQLGGHYSQRWELYFNGVELCNCYTEQTEAAQLKSLFLEEEKIQGAPMDEDFITACSRLGRCSGNALGVDRLLMLLLNKNDIEEILIPC